MEKILIRDLEIDLWEACNLKCSHCTHASPFFTNEDEYYTYEHLDHDLTILRKFANIHNMRIVGGEPLMNKNLLSYVKMMRQKDMSVRLIMFTNGLLLKTVDPEIFRYLDALRISVYPLHKHLLDKIESGISYVREAYPHLSIAANEIGYFKEFHTLEKIQDQQLVQKIYEHCYYAYENEGLSSFNGRLYRCFAARKKYKYLKTHAALVKDDFEYLKNNTHDSIELNEQLTKEDLLAFLSRKDAPEACKWCLGCSGAFVPNKQLANGEPDFGSISKIDFESGESDTSNCILSWAIQSGDYDSLKGNERFSSKHIKNFSKHFTTKSFKK